jgi:glycosyltransferase
MKISIITVVYNSVDTIQHAIDSVLGQSYDNIEYIVVDGASKDGTLEVLEKNKNNIDVLISEQDNGIYDAMNKGLDVATGDIIGTLNSDDFYASNNIIQKVANLFGTKQVDSIYGDLIYVDAKNIDRVIRYWKSKPFQEGLFQKGWHPAHPTFFVKSEVYKKYGKFNTDLKIAADYEIMLRFLEKYQISSYYIPEVLVKMRLGGESNRNIKNIVKANMESIKAWKLNGLKVNPAFVFLKTFRKILQYKTFT